jgi:hypothetical protein
MVKMVSRKRGKSIEASIKRGKMIFTAAPMIQRSMGTKRRERGGVSMAFIKYPNCPLVHIYGKVEL